MCRRTANCFWITSKVQKGGLIKPTAAGDRLDSGLSRLCRVIHDVISNWRPATDLSRDVLKDSLRNVCSRTDSRLGPLAFSASLCSIVGLLAVIMDAALDTPESKRLATRIAGSNPLPPGQDGRFFARSSTWFLTSSHCNLVFGNTAASGAGLKAVQLCPVGSDYVCFAS